MKNKELELYTPEELAAKEKTANLCLAMGILLKLEAEFCKTEGTPIKGFEKITHELKREYIPFDTLLENRYREFPGTILRDVFARSEIERINDLLSQVKQLSDASYYSQHKTKLRAEEYIHYLSQYKTDEQEAGTTSAEKHKGRPQTKNKKIRSLRSYISGEDDLYQKVYSALKTRIAVSCIELIKVIIVLRERDYYIKEGSLKELHNTLCQEIGYTNGYRSFTKAINSYSNNLIKHEKDIINELLP